MKTQRFGDIRVDSITEFDHWTVDPAWLLDGATPEHVDHVGWNTMLMDGRWVPTFPNARYLISRGEYAWWTQALATGQGPAVFEDSVLPIVQHGRGALVDHSANNLVRKE